MLNVFTAIFSSTQGGDRGPIRDEEGGPKTSVAVDHVWGIDCVLV